MGFNSGFKGLITKTTNKMQLCRLIYYSLSALHVSGDVFLPIVRSTWLYSQHLVIFTNVAAGWCHRCIGTWKQPTCWLFS